MIDYYYSDPHFGHANIVAFANRPFTPATQTEELIRRYNSVVSEHNLVLWLGDCFFTDKSIAKDIMSQLYGRKGLVMGNHDRNTQWMIDVGFDFVAEHELYVGLPGVAERVKCCHFPYDYTDGPSTPVNPKHEYLLHGHTHSPIKRQGNMIHVGVDAWDWAPASAEAVAALILGGE